MGCAGKDGEVERMMERITFDGNFCDISQCRELPCQHGGNCSQKQVWERLKEYEDTGLSPAGLEYAAEIEEGLNKSGYSMERWVELMKADKERCVVVLPCKVGDTVYLLFAGNPNNPVISTLKINTVAEAVKLIGKMGMHKYIGTFRTREEAEKALEAIQNE